MNSYIFYNGKGSDNRHHFTATFSIGQNLSFNLPIIMSDSNMLKFIPDNEVTKMVSTLQALLADLETMTNFFKE